MAESPPEGHPVVGRSLPWGSLRRVAFRPAVLPRALAVGLFTVVLSAGLAVALPIRARAQTDDAVAIESITNLNKRALEEYDNLNFDKAKKTLNEALELCTQKGLDTHPIKARTFIHMGVVILAGGATERDAAIKEFQKALAIEPGIRLTARVANPEVQSAFDEAAKSAPAKPPTAPTTPSTTPKAAVEPEPPTMGLEHTPITSAVQGSVIPVSVTTDAALEAKKVVLVFRAAGERNFLQIELKEYSTGNWSGSIPDSATEGDEVAYAISVQNGNGEVVATHGSPEAPLVIRLKADTAAEPDKPDEPDEPERPEPLEPPTWFLGLSVGSGIGYATGYGDINDRDKVTSGFGGSKLGHVLPEVGYFVSSDLILSLQLRVQMVSGATPVRDPRMMDCGAPAYVCDPASSAIAGLARLIWLFGDGPFLPYLSLTAGAGQIRHLATFPGKNDNCGSDITKPVKCVDTVTAGPILLGPGAGFILNATPNFGFTLGVNTLLGFPAFTFHVDFNGGIVIQL